MPVALFVSYKFGNGGDVNVASVMSKFHVDEFFKGHGFRLWQADSDKLLRILKDVRQNFRSGFGGE